MVFGLLQKAAQHLRGAVGKAVHLAKGAADYRDRAISTYNKIRENPMADQAINHGVKLLMNHVGQEKADALRRGVTSANGILEAVRKDGDQVVRRMEEVERMSGLNAADQARMLAEQVRKADFSKLRDVAGPIERLAGSKVGAAVGGALNKIADQEGRIKGGLDRAEGLASSYGPQARQLYDQVKPAVMGRGYFSGDKTFGMNRQMSAYDFAQQFQQPDRMMR